MNEAIEFAQVAMLIGASWYGLKTLRARGRRWLEADVVRCSMLVAYSVILTLLIGVWGTGSGLRKAGEAFRRTPPVRESIHLVVLIKREINK